VTSKAYLVVLCGAGDRPIARLGNRTPLQVARTPNLDRLAASGRVGLVEVIGRSIPPESDSGAMALLGYDPLRYYTGRGALEGLGMGFLDPGRGGQACFRINFASYDPAAARLDRRTARDLDDGELTRLVGELRAGVRLPAGAGFLLHGFARHRGILCLHRGSGTLSGNVSNTDPGFRNVGGFGVPNADYEPTPLACEPLDDTPAAAATAELVNRLVEEAHRVLEASEVNRARRAAGKLPANMLLVRDGGHLAPDLSDFGQRFGLSLAMYGQVPAERGVCQLLGGRWQESAPPTNGRVGPYYRALAGALLGDTADVVFVHVKGPDEPGHDDLPWDKVASLELIDEELVGPLAAAVRAEDVFVVTSDHRTPCELGIHSADPVPMLITGAGIAPGGASGFSEYEPSGSQLGFERACELMDIVAARLGGRA
jgi:2,3-bisphosphoglycerate-independent phosphoglycerate mutase